MPDPNTSPAHGNNVNLSAAPGGDLNFDDLFPPESQELGNLPPQAPANGTVTPPVPQAPPPSDEPFLRAPTGTVYKTREEAERGYAEKDAAIERLRQYAIERTGFDPLTGKPVVQAPPQTAPQNYTSNRKQYFTDLVDRIQKNDQEGYAEVQQKFVQDTLAPYTPLLADLARQNAIRKVSGEVKDFGSFVDGEDYRKTIDSIPLLKDAISNAESNLQLSGTLGDLYKIAYLASQGVRATSVQPPPVVVPQAPPPSARPTLSSSSMTPPAPGTAPDLRTSEGRKQLIKDMESRGVQDFKF